MILFLGRDLNARARIGSTGADVVPVSAAALGSALETHRPAALVIDLDERSDETLRALEDAHATGLLPPAVWGFYSHVDASALDWVGDLPVTTYRRGKFWGAVGDLVAGLN